MPEGGVSTEEDVVAAQEKAITSKDLVDQLREKYVQAMRMREATSEDFYRRGQTKEEQLQATRRMHQENERIRRLKEAAKDEISGQLASALLTAAPTDRSVLLGGIKDITGLKQYEGKGVNAQHQHTLTETVDLMSRTMGKLAEAKAPRSVPLSAVLGS